MGPDHTIASLERVGNYTLQTFHLPGLKRKRLFRTSNRYEINSEDFRYFEWRSVGLPSMYAVEGDRLEMDEDV